jgi:YVTN family beta-propeller protein
LAASLLAATIGAAPAAQREAVRTYITNFGGDGVSVVDPAKNEVTHTLKVGQSPHQLTCTPDGQRAVVSNTGSSDVSIIAVSQRTVVATVKVVAAPKHLAMAAVAIR